MPAVDAISLFVATYTSRNYPAWQREKCVRVAATLNTWRCLPEMSICRYLKASQWTSRSLSIILPLLPLIGSIILPHRSRFPVFASTSLNSQRKIRFKSAARGSFDQKWEEGGNKGRTAVHVSTLPAILMLMLMATSGASTQCFSAPCKIPHILLAHKLKSSSLVLEIQ